MTTATTPDEDRVRDAGEGDLVVDKGLRRNIIGLLGGTVLGIVETAETYSIAVTLGFLVIAVGAQAPAALILGFIPILCMTIAERGLVSREPDAGTVFVWVGKALGPRLGWITSFGLTTIFGIGGVFVIGVGAVLLGVALMAVWNLRSRSFFRGETFTPGWAAGHAPDLT